MEITSNVPVPEVRRAGAKRVYPFDQMAVGDSLSFDDLAEFQKARRAATAHGKKYKQVFTSRKGWIDGEYTEEGGSIWRVE